MTEMTYDEIIKILDLNGFGVHRKAALRDYDRYLDQSEFQYILWLDRIYQKIQSVPGHIIEIGVARGRNAVLFGHLIKMNGDQAVRHYYGFDTFSGYAEDDLRRSPHLSTDAWKETTIDFVRERLEGQSLASICHLFKGDIKSSASDFVKKGHARFNPNKIRISLLYIDCNAYLPAKFAMDFFKPFMMKGSVICIDEKLQGGETEALIEFGDENGLEVKRDPGPFGIPAYLRFEETHTA